MPGKFIFIVMLLAPGRAFPEVVLRVSETDGAVSRAFYDGDTRVALEVYDKMGVLTAKTGKIPDGPVKTYHDNGKTATESAYLNQKMNGEMLEYYKSGALRGRLNFKAGKLHGAYTLFHDSGGVFVEMSFVNGAPEGGRKVYYQSGALEVESSFRKGAPDGAWLEYFDGDAAGARGPERAEVFYKKGRLEGAGTEYYRNGLVKYEFRCRRGLVDGYAARFSEEGKKMWEYRPAGKKKLGFVRFDRSGRKAREAECVPPTHCYPIYLEVGCMYKERGYEYYESGKIKRESSGQGYDFKDYDENGRLMNDFHDFNPLFVKYATAAVYGLGASYHENGKPRLVLSYDERRKVYTRKSYSPGGVLISECNEAENDECRCLKKICREYSPSGELLRIDTYHNDEMINTGPAFLNR